MKTPAKVVPRPRGSSSRSSSRSSSHERTQFNGIPVLVVVALLGGVFAAQRLGRATRHMARTDWSPVPELAGLAIGELPLANGLTVPLADGSTAHVVYLFQSDCSTCDAQRAHVAELLEAVPSGQAVSASAQSASAVQGYWSDLGSPLAPPVGADSAWLASKHLDGLPLILFVDKAGRVAKAIRGSLLSWSDQAVLAELQHAGG
jgi:hypothetical protein